jgi:hypothetical protein
MTVWPSSLGYLDRQFGTDRFAQVAGHTILRILRLRLFIHDNEHPIGAMLYTGPAPIAKLLVNFDQNNFLTPLPLRKTPLALVLHYTA